MRAAKYLAVVILQWAIASAAYADLLEISYRGKIHEITTAGLSRDVFLSDSFSGRLVIDLEAQPIEAGALEGAAFSAYPVRALEITVGDRSYSAALGAARITVVDVDENASDWPNTFPADTYSAASGTPEGPEIVSSSQPELTFAPTLLSVAGRGTLDALAGTDLDVRMLEVLDNIRMSLLFEAVSASGLPVACGIDGFAVAVSVCRIIEKHHGGPRRRCSDLVI